VLVPLGLHVGHLHALPLRLLHLDVAAGGRAGGRVGKLWGRAARREQGGRGQGGQPGGGGGQVLPAAGCGWRLTASAAPSCRCAARTRPAPAV
jgi:hypothetical protein